MRYLKALFALLLCAGLIFVLDRPWGKVPAIGQLLDPFSGVWANAREAEDYTRDQQLSLEALDGPVSVRYDTLGIPHVFATNYLDAIRVQGYVTARDRLWQMEFQTHAAAGRLSEILGPDLEEKGDGRILRFDRLQRRMGMGYAAEQALSAMVEDDSVRQILTAYAQGVNALISSLTFKDFPIEYKILGYAPEPWTPLKTALLLKYMGQDLSSTEYDLPHTFLRARLGAEAFAELYPNDANTSPIVPAGSPFEFEPLPVGSPADSEAPAFAQLPFSEPVPDKGIGSNNWAVHGSRTSSGMPILCNDPHLQLNLPSIWYQIQLHTPEINVCGASLPGAPGIVLGFNRDIAWGVTNAGRDVRDWYKISYKDQSRQQYQYEGEWRNTNTRIEKIVVKGGKIQYDTVCYTHHGPVVYDRSFEHAQLEAYALRWELHQASNEMKMFLILNSAKGLDDYKRALPYFQCPGQNVLLATRDGDIAITQQGRFPLRWKDQGRFLLDGSRADHEWAGYIPIEHNPQSINPERGYVSSANQYPADSSYPYDQLGYYEEFRNQRINQQLDQMGNAISPEDLMQLQLDNYGQLAADALPLMLKAYPQAEGEFSQWDYQYDATSFKAARFQSWYDKLYELIWDEIDALDGPVIKPQHYQTIALMARDPQSIWFDHRSTEQREDLSALAEWAWKESQTEKSWWEYKSTSINHLLNLQPFNRTSVQNGGYRHIVNATSERHGPSWRMVVELTDPPRAWGIYPGSQSGHPASAEYGDFIPDWAAGNYYPLVYLLYERDQPQSTGYTLYFKASGSGDKTNRQP